MRVNSDKQTLILAGEPLPRRGVAESSAEPAATASRLQRITIIATRADDTTLLVQGEYENRRESEAEWLPQSQIAVAAPSEPLRLPATRAPSMLTSTPYRIASSSAQRASRGASEYARTQELGAEAVLPLIDTYA